MGMLGIYRLLLFVLLLLCFFVCLSATSKPQWPSQLTITAKSTANKWAVTPRPCRYVSFPAAIGMWGCANPNNWRTCF